MRCAACNSKMQDYEMLSINPASGDYEEMCRKCINASTCYIETSEEDLDISSQIDSLLKDPTRFVDDC